MSFLSVSDINNLHLVSYQYNEIANHHPVQLTIQGPKKDLADILQSSRNFEDMKIEFIDGLKHSSTFRRFFEKFGKSIKHLSMYYVTIDMPFLMQLLELSQNLESLCLDWVSGPTSPNTSITYKETGSVSKLPNLKKLYLKSSTMKSEVLTYCQNSKITEGVFECIPEDILGPFLKAQEMNLKRLTINSMTEKNPYGKIFSELKNMRLEYFEYRSSIRVPIENDHFLEFMKQHPNLKYFGLKCVILVDNVLNAIIDSIKTLDTLEIEFTEWRVSSNCSDRIYKLKGPKKISITMPVQLLYDTINVNILNGLQFGINQELEELKVPFLMMSKECIKGFPTYLPNLKRLEIELIDTANVDYIFKYFTNLELLKINFEDLDRNRCRNYSMKKHVMPNLKHLHIKEVPFSLTTNNARMIAKNFPNLEYLQIEYCRQLNNKCAEILVKSLKKLKKVKISVVKSKFEQNKFEEFLKTSDTNLKIIEIDNDDYEFEPINIVIVNIL